MQQPNIETVLGWVGSANVDELIALQTQLATRVTDSLSPAERQRFIQQTGHEASVKKLFSEQYA